MGEGEHTAGLQRSIGFWPLLAFSVGINIGAGLFVLVNVAAGLAGAAVPVAMMLAAVPAFLALVPYGVLARGYPTTAATYRYAKLVHPGVAFAMSAMVAPAILIGGQPLYGLIAGEYLAELLPLSPLLVAVVALTVFYVVNLLGVRPTAIVQVLLVAALLVSLAVFLVLGVGSIDTANFTAALPAGVGGVLAGAGLLYALMAGGLFIVDVGDEVSDPARLYRAVLPLGMIVVLVIYVGIVVVTVGAVPWRQLEDSTLVAAAELFMGSGALALFIAGAVVAGLTTMNIAFTLVSRAVLVVADDGLIPRALGRVNGRYGTPHVALTACYVISLTALLFQPSRRFLGTTLNLGLVLAIGIVSWAGARLPARHPDVFRASGVRISPRVLTITGYAVVSLNGLIALLLTAALPAATAALALIGLLAAVYWRARRATLLTPAQQAEPS